MRNPLTLRALALSLTFGWVGFGACSDAADNALGADCESDGECIDGLRCIDARCLPPGCSECPVGERCNDEGVCQAGIGCESPCTGDTFCSVSGECIPNGSCNADEDCGTALKCDQAQHLCVPDDECGAQEFVLEGVPPNVMLVVDRTGSMDAEVPNSGGLSRWEVASQAITTLLQNYGGSINFGMVLFSACTGDGCEPGTIVNPIGSAAADINQTVAQTQLCFSGNSETVIGGTLQALVGNMTLQDPGRDNAVVLITDGEDNCGGGGPQAATALVNQPIPVQTYVIGFSGDVNAGELQAIAQAAGTDPYIQADDAQQLNSALQTIAASVASCTYSLAMPPSSEMYVFFNDDPNGVDNDPNNGWTYDPATGTLTFHGAACDAIQNGQVSDIDVVFGCAVPTPE
jgi:hypothetical protein